jgi:hypothetical protein
MTLDGFLTFLTLAVAIYALVPPVTKLGARLALWPQVPLALFAFCLVIYFQFYQALAQPCPRILGTACRFLVPPPSGSAPEQSTAKVNPQQLSFVVMLVWGLVAFVVFKATKPQAGALPRMQQVVYDLMHEGRYGEVLQLTQPHLQLIYRAANRRLRLQRWHDFFAASRPGSFGAAARWPNRMDRQPAPTWRERFVEFARERTWWLYKVIPNGDAITEAGDSVLQVLCGSEDLIEFMANMRPYAAVPILALDDRKSRELSDQYFKYLARNPRSMLYYELRNNQNEDDINGYWSDARNKLLYFIFNDARVAYRLEVYRPIGEQTIQMLDPNRNHEYINSLNRFPGGFSDEEEWKDPVFCSLLFFDIMITSAARQAINRHMWLYYFRNFIDGLVRAYDETGPGIDVDAEWPNRTAFLIYRAFKMLVKWASLVRYLAAESVHVQFPGGVVTQDNGNIPASAVFAFSQSIGSFIMAKNIGPSFKASIHEAIMHDLDQLRRDGAQGVIRAGLIQALVSGGRRAADPAYGRIISGLFGQADHVLRDRLNDYEAALRAAHPGPMAPTFTL